MANKLNDKQVKAMLREGKPVRFAVDNGLYFRVSSEGNGFWEVRYSIHGKRRQITLDRYPQMTLVDARAKTAFLKADINKGIDPLAERKRAELKPIHTVNQLAEDWLSECAKRLKHPQIPRRVYEKDLAPIIGELSLQHVNPRDIRAALSNIASSGRPTIANDALMYCKQLFRHGIKLDLISSNPADAFRVSDAGGVEKSRSRVLTFEELTSVLSVLRENSDQFTRENYLAFALLVVLGVRKGELITAEWLEFNLDESLWDIPKERSKMGASITVPLPIATVDWLRELKIRAYGSKYVFPNRRASKRFGHISLDTLNAAVQKLYKENKFVLENKESIEHFTLHDLRRTCRSMLAEAGVAGHVAERCLNHKLKGVEGIYDRYDYLDERRDALQKIALLIEPIVNQDTY